MNNTTDLSEIGVVVIGRNEGDRLKRCLTSLDNVDKRVYVDSGSTDGSRDTANALGFSVVALDMSIPFSAARARNSGIELLLERYPELKFIQTVDGDCEVRRGWLERATADMATDDKRAVVFGRRREREPRRNAYHLACDEEWDVPTGEVASCGGDALLRVSALREVAGYNPELIAGEEPDMCLRLRARSWRIWSNGAEMTWHDVSIDRMKQWWTRARRAGFAFAELNDRHGLNADPAWRRLIHSALFWTGVIISLVIATCLIVTTPRPLTIVICSIAALLLVTQTMRMTLNKRRRLGAWGAFRWSILVMIAKVAQSSGWAQFKLQQRAGRKAELIEYKY